MPSQSSFPLEKLRANRNSIESLPFNFCLAGVACVVFRMGCQSSFSGALVVVSSSGSTSVSVASSMLKPGGVKGVVVDLERACLLLSATGESSSALACAEQRSNANVNSSGSSNCCQSLNVLAMAGRQRQLLHWRFLLQRVEDVLWLSLVTQL